MPSGALEQPAATPQPLESLPSEATGQASLRMAGLLSARFRQGMRPLALGTALCVALSAPLADFLLERHDIAGRAQLRANGLAARLVQEEKAAGVLQRQAVNDVLQAMEGTVDPRGSEELAHVEVRDAGGRLLAQSVPRGVRRTWPLVWSEAPLVVGDQIIGTVTVAVGEREWLYRDLLLFVVFGVLGTVLGLALYFFPLRLFREDDLMRLFAWRSIKAAEEERLRLSRDLHDGVGQTLGAAAVAMARLGARSGGSAEAAEGARLIDAALDEVRRVARGLRPPSLDDLGLGAAVEGLAREVARTGLAVELDIAPLPRLEPELEQTCFRLAQEALANVVRHARARTVQVKLAPQESQLVLEVIDDGRGFSPRQDLGLGLVGARERAARLSGHLTIDSARGQGTRLRAVLPLRSEL